MSEVPADREVVRVFCALVIDRQARDRLDRAIAAAARVCRVEARELTQEVIADTVMGEIPWEGGDAFRHVVVWARRKVAADERWRRLPLDALSDDDTPTVDPHAADDDAPAADAGALVDRVRDAAQGDPDVLAVLDALAGGVYRRREVIAVARLSGSAYHNAARRLRRLAVRARAGAVETTAPPRAA